MRELTVTLQTPNESYPLSSLIRTIESLLEYGGGDRTGVFYPGCVTGGSVKWIENK